ncbi:MAG: class I SAM-dependent methyltransferase [Gemmatimonadaceae bacterium]|nr:class I SAM-dependent methyltransferase [Gemmatimonadaceae bacterium]MCW5827472.1 class I SAM-dependent methyltransferase [Gemmatimonadaceae bacterium]
MTTRVGKPLSASLRDLLLDPRVRALDVDSPEFSLAHRRVLLAKPLVQQLFREFYRRCRALDDRLLAGEGLRVEIGSGSGFMCENYPDVITSDVKPLPFVQLVFRGEEMPFRDSSLRALYAINTFHHLQSPRAFFEELNRVLVPGGGAILIEPYYGPFARWLFPRLHASEGFDMDASTWESSAVAGPFSDANQALSYIVFKRDRALFEAEFPGLAIVHERPHTHLQYLLSGGVNFRQLVPSFLGGALVAAERLLAPIDRWLALQHTIVLRRNPNP